ncbi:MULTISPECIES: beta strand repeat-containing protein [unclassified Inquilinus]|uniref:beta strand repeat-containing protein n=1 Tax=unclassified Inquilinus TaxID=2645927 RepID=UPI003F8E3D70
MPDPFFGTPGDDNLSFVTINDPIVVYGLAGNDTISSGSNSDLLDGGDGNDLIIGASGNDHLVGGDGNDITSGGPGNDWHEGGNGDDTLQDDAGSDTLDGGAGNDALTGGADDDALYAGTGSDYLSGGTGNDRLVADGSFADRADTLSGGDGNDVYVLAGANVVLLAPDPGQDRIEASVSFSLAGFGEIEDLTLTGAAAIDGAGNGLANDLFGNDAANVLDGGGGNDLIRGFGGNDTLIAGFGGGVEYMYGGTGDDAYVVADLQDTPVDFAGEGHDTVYSPIRWVLGNNLEDLVLTGADSVNGFGNALDNHLVGNAGNNYLQGFAGRDTLEGGAGNDYYELGDRTAFPNGIGHPYDIVVEGAGAGIDTISVTAIDDPDMISNGYTLVANVENGIVVGTLDFNLAGNALANALTGNAALNTLTGNDGNDVLDGAAGLDTLVGGAGNDTYVLNDQTFIDDQSGWEYDRVVEAANGGVDTVLVSFQANIRYYLDANIENVQVTGGTGLDVIGNDLGNVLTGNGAHNLFYGQGGDDTLNGGAGIDQLLGGDGNDTYILGDVTLISGSLQFDSVGEAAGGGIDTVQVSSTLGRLTYVLDDNVENAVATGGANFNLVGNTLANLLTGNAAANVLTGDAGNDTLDGGAGDDSLIGGAGADTLYGRGGNDLFYVDTAADRVVEVAGGGSDRVLASVSYALAAGSEVEILTTTGVAGTAAIALTGNAFGQTIAGNAGANVIDGGAGADTLYGYGGNDLYYVDEAGDKVIEAAGGGSDRVLASVNYVLAAGSEIEMLSTTSVAGTAAIALTGNAFGQIIAGNAGANAINGGAGADTLYGYGGNDLYYVDNSGDRVVEAAGGGSDRVLASVSHTLTAGSEVEVLSTTSAVGTAAIALTGNAFSQTIVGNAGANVIDGGAGADTLYGDGGNDSFRFDTTLGAANIDRVLDFSVPADTIQLENAVFTGLAAGSLAAGAFHAGAAAQDVDDRIIYNSATGALLFDHDGLGGTAAVQFATLSAGLAMTSADFFVT